METVQEQWDKNAKLQAIAVHAVLATSVSHPESCCQTLPTLQRRDVNGKKTDFLAIN